MEQIKSMSAAVIVVIDNMASGTRFHGNELHDKVAAIYPEARTMYTDTVMRMMRRHCKGEYRSIDHNKSLFEKV